MTNPINELLRCVYICLVLKAGIVTYKDLVYQDLVDNLCNLLDILVVDLPCFKYSQVVFSNWKWLPDVTCMCF